MLLLVEEFKLGKAQLFQMLCNSRDPLVKNAQPSIITGRKRKSKLAVENAESAVKIKEIIGTVANGRAGLGLHPQCWWSKESTINKRNRAHVPSGRMQKTAVIWGDLKHMESQKLSFLIKAV